MPNEPRALSELPLRETARILGFAIEDEALVFKLREIGFAEGDEVEILHKGFLFGSPLSIRLNRSLIALRKSEARQIQVQQGSDS